MKPYSIPILPKHWDFHANENFLQTKNLTFNTIRFQRFLIFFFLFLQSGLSCLHISATLGHDQVVEILCKNKADINQSITIDEQPVTAYDLALTQEKTNVCNILVKYGYQINN